MQLREEAHNLQTDKERVLRLGLNVPWMVLEELNCRSKLTIELTLMNEIIIIRST